MAQNAYPDDVTILADCRLFRRVNVEPQLSIVWDGNEGRWRPSSAAFTDSPDGSPMSIVLGTELEAAGRQPESVLTGHEGFALAYVTAEQVRAQQQAVVRNPLPEETAHGLVAGAKSRSVRKKMASEAIWVVAPNLPAPDV